MFATVSGKTVVPLCERINTSYIASEGIAQPLRPSCRLSSFEPRINPTTALLSSSTIGPPNELAVGTGRMTYVRVYHIGRVEVQTRDQIDSKGT